MKVYLVMDQMDNEEIFEDRDVMTEVIAVCVSEEKAKQIIGDFVPSMLEELTYTDSEGNEVTEHVTITERNDSRMGSIRCVNENRDNFEEWTHYLYIDEREMEV